LIDKVSDPLMRVKYSALLAQQQRELRDTILRWARQGDFLVQAKAINLGLMWDAGPEFFQIAVGLLGDKDHPARPLLAWAIGQYAKLGPAEVEQVKKLALAEPAGDLRDSLRRCLEFRPTPQAQQALRELQSAAATRPAASAPGKP
jgi:hypothetical protein